MFASHSQVGRSCVNRCKEGSKRPPKSREINKYNGYEHRKPRSSISVPKKKYKRLGQIKETQVTIYDKMIQLQNNLFKEGLSFQEYKDYVQEKINTNKYYYTKISEDELSKLMERYKRLVQARINRYNEIGDKKEMNRRQRRLYREKKSKLVNEKKRELINLLFTKMKNTTSVGVLRDTHLLSDEPSRWKNSKKLLFLGGRYIESHDKKWVDIYSKIVSPNTAHLFDLQTGDDLFNYILSQ